MIRITSQNELLDSFRPMERAEVELPKDLKFPFVMKDYHSWLEPSGARVYLVFEPGEGRPPLGIVFRRDQSPAGAPPTMCEWCHAVRSGDGVGMLTATASSHRRVGLNLCRDLSCKEKLAAAPGADDLQETLSGRQRLQRVVRRMSDFARRDLF